MLSLIKLRIIDRGHGIFENSPNSFLFDNLTPYSLTHTLRYTLSKF
jgi:hypothetical protein